MRGPLLTLALAVLTACGQAPPEPASTPETPRSPLQVLARVGSDHRPARVTPPLQAQARKLATRTRNALPAHDAFEVEVPASAERLDFSIACPGDGEADCPAFRIEAQSGEGRTPAFEGSAGDTWSDHVLTLPAGTRALRFSLAGDGDAARALWGSPLLLGPTPATHPSIVLVSLDTLGAASLGSFSGEAGTSPRLDALFGESADFRRAIAQYGNTLVSHASLFSALYPVRHGVYPDSVPGPLRSSLVGRLAAAGYRTLSFTEGAFVSAAFGFAEGFDAYDDGSLGLSAQMAGGAAETFERAAAWLEQEGDRGPFFLFVHTYEVHTPYLPRDEAAVAVASRLSPGDARRFPAALQASQIFNHNHGRELLSQRDLTRLRALHVAEVSTLDRLVGGFLDRLDSLGLADDTLLVVTADHGDQFGEWGKVGHGNSLHDRVIHVPLAFRWPGRIPPRRIEAPVQLVDVLPTLLGLAGLTLPPDLDGRSLAPFWSDEDAPARPAFAEQRTAPGECDRLGLPAGCRLDRTSVHEGQWKLVKSTQPAWRRLYDLSSDAQETGDVAERHPEIADRLERRVDEYRAAEARDAGSGETLDADTLQRLRELGYLIPEGAGP